MFLVEWSHQQNCFHVTTLNQAVKDNREAMIDGTEIQFVPVFASESESEAEDTCTLMQSQRDARDRLKTSDT